MEALVNPDLGLIVWQTVVFLVLVFILGRFAWGPIISSLKEREQTIETALGEAKKARDEMASLKSQNEALLKQAREERDNLLREAKVAADKLVSDAREQAKVQADAMIARAQATIQQEKNAAIAELKNQVADISLNIAQRVVGNTLANGDAQRQLISELVGQYNN